MKNIEKIKFYIGIILIAFALIGGLIFYLESFGILDSILSMRDTSRIWEDGAGDGSGASNTPNFLGLCAVAGSLLLMTVKKTEQLESNKETE